MRRDTIDQKKRWEENPEMPASVRRALDNLLKAQFDLQTAQRQAGGDSQNPALVAARERLEGVWKQGQMWLDALVFGAAAGPMGQELNYQLALVKHEQAERLQLRLDQAVRAAQAPANELDEARLAWQNAADSWAIYIQENPESPMAPAARFHSSRVHWRLSELHARQASDANLPPDEREAAIRARQAAREAALDLLRDLSKLTDLEKVGRLALARKLDQKK
jgi:hypothetical protein